GYNKVGLTDKGKDLMELLIDNSMLIDANHMSWAAVDDTFEIAKKHKYYPVFASHTRFMECCSDETKELVKEYVTPHGMLKTYKQLGGIIGLRTGPDAMILCPGAKKKVP